MEEVKKAIIPVAGKGTRFLPLSKALPKEMIPLGDRPLIHWAVREAKQAGIEEIIFVENGSRKLLESYFKRNQELEEMLEEKGDEELLSELRSVEEMLGDTRISFVSDKPKGDGHAIMRAASKVGEEAVLIMYPDDVIAAEPGASVQLTTTFRTSQRPMFALAEVPEDRVSSYGIVGGTKVTNRVYKISSMVEKPDPGKAPSNLAVVGRSVITPDVFGELRRLSRSPKRGKGELRLTNTAAAMVDQGKAVYGYEFKGEWLECGTKEEWLRSFLYWTLSSQEGKELKKYLEKRKLV